MLWSTLKKSMKMNLNLEAMFSHLSKFHRPSLPHPISNAKIIKTHKTQSISSSLTYLSTRWLTVSHHLPLNRSLNLIRARMWKMESLRKQPWILLSSLQWWRPMLNWCKSNCQMGLVSLQIRWTSWRGNYLTMTGRLSSLLRTVKLKSLKNKK